MVFRRRAYLYRLVMTLFAVHSPAHRDTEIVEAIDLPRMPGKCICSYRIFACADQRLPNHVPGGHPAEQRRTSLG